MQSLFESSDNLKNIFLSVTINNTLLYYPLKGQSHEKVGEIRVMGH
jgi:hypothetical protein